ncbi:MFS transporter, partial [Morganella morganii]
MKKLENFHLLVMLIALIAVGQMTQTVYVPVITDIALDFGKPAGAVQSVMAAYLFTYGASQLIYGPISDKVGRRPVILTGLFIYVLSTTAALFSPNLTMLVIASGLQGLGTGVAGVMARTMPRDLYTGISLRYAN